MVPPERDSVARRTGRLLVSASASDSTEFDECPVERSGREGSGVSVGFARFAQRSRGGGGGTRIDRMFFTQSRLPGFLARSVIHEGLHFEPPFSLSPSLSRASTSAIGSVTQTRCDFPVVQEATLRVWKPDRICRTRERTSSACAVTSRSGLFMGSLRSRVQATAAAGSSTSSSSSRS